MAMADMSYVKLGMQFHLYLVLNLLVMYFAKYSLQKTLKDIIN